MNCKFMNKAHVCAFGFYYQSKLTKYLHLQQLCRAGTVYNVPQSTEGTIRSRIVSIKFTTKGYVKFSTNMCPTNTIDVRH